MFTAQGSGSAGRDGIYKCYVNRKCKCYVQFSNGLSFSLMQPTTSGRTSRRSKATTARTTSTPSSSTATPTRGSTSSPSGHSQTPAQTSGKSSNEQREFESRVHIHCSRNPSQTRSVLNVPTQNRRSLVYDHDCSAVVVLCTPSIGGVTNVRYFCLTIIR